MPESERRFDIHGFVLMQAKFRERILSRDDQEFVSRGPTDIRS